MYAKPGWSKAKFREKNSYRAKTIRRVSESSKPRQTFTARGQGDHLLSPRPATQQCS